MRKHKLLMKIISITAVFALFGGMLSYYDTSYTTPVFATTRSELEQQKKDNAAKQEAIKKKINNSKNNQSKQKEYLSSLEEQRDAIEENIGLLYEQIMLLDDNIAQLNTQIEDQEKDIDAKIEKFKQRMRAMYISGDNSMASVLAGSQNFYDLLARTEMVKRIADHDDKLIDDLNEMLAELNENKTQVESDKTEAENARAELQQQKDELDKAYDDNLSVLKQEEANYQAYLKEQKQTEAEEAKIEAAIQKLIQEEMSKNSVYVGGELTWPTPGYTKITSYYGMRWGKLHKGIDITGSSPGQIAGAPIVAANDGKVIFATNNYTPHYSYGKYLMIDHGGGTVTLYGHCNQVIVSAGQTVKKGQTVAYVGTTGDSTGYHLHFEVRVNGSTVNPMNYFTKKDN